MVPQLTFDAGRATIRLDAPEKRNALGPDDLRALSAALTEIERSDADVAILTGSGDTLCSGYDLRALRAEIASASDSAAQSAFANVADALESLPMPTICALRGGAYGGGTDLALACDLRVGTPGTVIAVPAARFGLQFYSGGLRRYVERLGLDAAKRIFLVGDTLDADTLLRFGFLHAVVADEDVDATVDTLARRICANERSAVRGLKRSLGAFARGIANERDIDAAFAQSLRAAETARRLDART